MKAWWRRVRPAVMAFPVYMIVRTLCATIRLKVLRQERLDSLYPNGSIICGWHGRSMLGAYLMRKKGHWVIISHSRDGQIQTKIFKRFGYQVIRGSTGRGGERALVESLRVLKRGERMAITPDGPRGPDRQVQGGVLMMAKKTGAALIPVGTGARPCKLVPTWDSYMVPFLFAKACFAVGEPIYVPQDANDVTMEAKRLELQRAIEVVQAEAEEFVR